MKPLKPCKKQNDEIDTRSTKAYTAPSTAKWDYFGGPRLVCERTRWYVVANARMDDFLCCILWSRIIKNASQVQQLCWFYMNDTEDSLEGVWDMFLTVQKCSRKEKGKRKQLQ